MTFVKFMELNEYFLGTRKTTDSHEGVAVGCSAHKDIDVDNTLFKILKSLIGDKEIHILHRDNQYSQKFHKLSGVNPRQDKFQDKTDTHVKYMKMDGHEVARVREFHLEISDYYNTAGKDKVQQFLHDVQIKIEKTFKKLGFFTLVKVRSDDEVMLIKLIVSHNSYEVPFKELMKFL